MSLRSIARSHFFSCSNFCANSLPGMANHPSPGGVKGEVSRLFSGVGLKKKRVDLTARVACFQFESQRQK